MGKDGITEDTRFVCEKENNNLKDNYVTMLVMEHQKHDEKVCKLKIVASEVA